MSEARAKWFNENLARVHDTLYGIGAARIAVVDHYDRSLPEWRTYEHWATPNGVLIVATLHRGEGRDAWFDVYAPLDSSNKMDNLIAAINAEGRAV